MAALSRALTRARMVCSKGRRFRTRRVPRLVLFIGGAAVAVLFLCMVGLLWHWAPAMMQDRPSGPAAIDNPVSATGAPADEHAKTDASPVHAPVLDPWPLLHQFAQPSELKRQRAQHDEAVRARAVS
jgi:hypothetical protein